MGSRLFWTQEGTSNFGSMLSRPSKKRWSVPRLLLLLVVCCFGCYFIYAINFLVRTSNGSNAAAKVASLEQQVALLQAQLIKQYADKSPDPAPLQSLRKYKNINGINDVDAASTEAPSVSGNEPIFVIPAKEPDPVIVDSLQVPGMRKFKVYGDPKICHQYWRWCYIRGNVETISYAFSSAGMGECKRKTLYLLNNTLMYRSRACAIRKVSDQVDAC